MPFQLKPPTTAFTDSAAEFLRKVQSDPAAVLRGIKLVAAGLEEREPQPDAPRSEKLDWLLRKDMTLAMAGVAMVLVSGGDRVMYAEAETVLLDVAGALDHVGPAPAARDATLLAASLSEADRALGRLNVVEDPDQG